MSNPLDRKQVHHRVTLQLFVNCTYFYVRVKRDNIVEQTFVSKD